MKFQNVDIAVCQCVHKVRPVMVTRIKATTDGTSAKNFCQSVQNRCREDIKEKKERQLESFLRYIQMKKVFKGI